MGPRAESAGRPGLFVRCLIAGVSLFAVATVMSWGVWATPSLAGAADAIAVTVLPSPIVADGVSTSTATATVTLLGAPVDGETVTITSSDPGQVVSAVTPVGGMSGKYTATIKSSTTVGSATITASDAGATPTALTAKATLTQTAPGSAPANITPPTISGASPPVQGSPLTASNGTWSGSPAPTITHQWQRCNSSGTGCVNILGATSASYTPTAADAGSTLVVVATATNTSGSAFAPSAATGVVTAPPVNTSLPTISGAPPIQGQVLTATPGGWSGVPAPTFTYQWQRCRSATGCANIAGATAATYTPVALDLGSLLKVVVTGHNSAGTGVGSSAETAVVTGAPTNSVLPTISGSPVQGQTLTAANGTWGGFPVPTFTYQWQRCDLAGANCVAIAGATASTYALTVADLGSTINVVVTATNSAGSAGATSAVTAVVIGAPVNTALPTISGATVAGQTLTATTGTWSGFPAPAFAYQWRDCNAAGTVCVAIAGATSSTYALTAADAGSAIDVVVTATSSAGSVAAASSPSALVTLTFYSSTTTLAASPNHAVTNQAVTLTATVAVTGNTATGTVTFEDAGTPITGCSSVPVVSSALSGTTTCSAAFAATTSPEQLTAVYTPAPATSVSGSTSLALTVTVGADTTTTVLTVSRPTVKTGVNVTYTATVTPGHAGPTEPTGTVDFYDGSTPIASCTVQPLTQGATSSTATCTSGYLLAGKRSIRAHYRPSQNFGASTSAPQTVIVVQSGPRPIVATTMRWTFLHTPTYTAILALVVSRAPAGGSLAITCTGRGCPYQKRVIMVAKLKACKPKPKHPCHTQLARTLDLTSSFKRSRLIPGTRLVIEVLKKGWIGKYYRFTVTAKVPTIRIACLAPGKRPGVGCTGA